MKTEKLDKPTVAVGAVDEILRQPKPTTGERITWRLSRGETFWDFDTESEAIAAREAFCGINQRDDYLIVSFQQLQSTTGEQYRFVMLNHAIFDTKSDAFIGVGDACYLLNQQCNSTTGEWTAERVEAIFNSNEDWSVKLSHAINAALAAEQEHSQNECARISKHWEQQLAAERTKHDNNCKWLQKQLAAERKKPKTTEYAQGWDDHVLAAKSQREELEQQLAAERKEVSNLIGGVNKVNAQLAAAQAAMKEVRAEHCDPNEAGYNECDTAPCKWCDDTKGLGTAALDAAIRDSHKRLYDLVRYCRSELHQAKLITDDEYARLVETGSESARRLEDYEQAKAAAQQPLVECLSWLREELKADEYYVEKIDIALAKIGEK